MQKHNKYPTRGGVNNLVKLNSYNKIFTITSLTLSLILSQSLISNARTKPSAKRNFTVATTTSNYTPSDVTFGDGKIDSANTQYLPEIIVYDYDGKGWRSSMSRSLQVEKIEKYGDLSAITGSELPTLAGFIQTNEKYVVGFAGKNVYTSHNGSIHIKYINGNPIQTGGVYYDSIKTTTDGDLVIYDKSGYTPLIYYKVSTNSVISMPTSSDLAGVEFMKTPSFDTEKETETDKTVVSITKESYDNMIKSCKDIDVDTLKNIKGLLTASTVTSGISTVGGIANTVMGGVSIANDKSEEDKSATNKKLDIASTIVSGVTTATSGASTATSAVAIGKVNAVIDKVNECKKAINNLVFKAD